MNWIHLPPGRIYVLVAVLYYVEIRQTIAQSEGCILDDIPVQSDFDETQYEGKWYEVLWRPTYFEDPDMAFIDYVEIYTGSEEGLSVDGYGRISEAHENCVQVGKTLTMVSPAKYTFPAKRVNDTFITDYWVIGTDYTHYSLVYGCTIQEGDICNTSHAWVWSRTPVLDQQYYDLIEEKLPDICLEMDDFMETVQNEECEGVVSSASFTSTTSAFTSWILLVILILRFQS